MGCWDENLFKYFESHDQDVFQAHLWKKFQKPPFFRKVGIQQRVLKYYQIGPNDDIGLT